MLSRNIPRHVPNLVPQAGYQHGELTTVICTAALRLDANVRTVPSLSPYGLRIAILQELSGIADFRVFFIPVFRIGGRKCAD
jgi:hypothetical protein